MTPQALTAMACIGGLGVLIGAFLLPDGLAQAFMAGGTGLVVLAILVDLAGRRRDL